MKKTPNIYQESPAEDLQTMEEKFLFDYMTLIIEYDKNMEKLKERLTLTEDFNLNDAFIYFDEDGSG
jgi:hypothetical protein